MPENRRSDHPGEGSESKEHENVRMLRGAGTKDRRLLMPRRDEPSMPTGTDGTRSDSGESEGATTDTGCDEKAYVVYSDTGVYGETDSDKEANLPRRSERVEAHHSAGLTSRAMGPSHEEVDGAHPPRRRLE